MTPGTRALVAAGLLLASASRATPAPPPILVEFPFGPVVRPGRPVAVRAEGAAAIRCGDGPWATGGGESGAEFLLLPPAAVSRTIELTIRSRGEESFPEESRGPQRPRFEVRILPAAGPVRAVFDPDAVRGPGDVLVDAATLPTLPEAWLLFDEVPVAPPGVAAAARDALERARFLPHPADPDRAAFQPWTSGPDPLAHRALAAVAARTPPVAGDTAAVLWVLALAELVLLVVVRRRPPWTRAAWLAVPAAAALAWLVATGRTAPAGIRATVLRLDGPRDALVLVRFEVAGSGAPAEGTLEVPGAAGSPVVVTWDADDDGRGVEIAGRAVAVSLEPGRSRVVAWWSPAAAPDGGAAPVGDADLPPEAGAWLAARGLRAAGGAGASAGSVAATDGVRLREAPPLRVAARK